MIDRVAFGGTSRTGHRNRSQPIEGLRIAAAFGIVLFHARPEHGALIGYSGLIIFLFLLAYFEARSSTLNIGSSASKLLIPWGFWFVVFALFNIVRSRSIVDGNQNVASDVLCGPSPHLWFLPFAFFVTAGLRLIKGSDNRRVLGVSAAILAVAAMLTKPYWQPWSLTEPRPTPEYALALIPILAGVASAWVPRTGFAATVAIMLIGAVQAWTFASGSGFVYAFGLGAVTLALYLSHHSIGNAIRFDTISRFMFGVYLSHPLFLSVFGLIHPLPTSLRVVLAFLGSLLLTWSVSGETIKRIGGRYRGMAYNTRP